MAEPSSRVLEGVFAIKKPQNLSSAQVLRDLQQKFVKSKTFEPLLQQTQDRERFSKPKRRRGGNDSPFKMGHGGTLDPLATGILIVGIGRGTKHLESFLGGKKTYETVVLFGKSTDTYDVMGKVVSEAPFDHITKSLVQNKMSEFRGKVRQVPPIYSALKIDGMKAYDYARSGKPLPRQLESRDMEVFESTMLDWYDAGEHDYRWPAEEASDEDKATAKRLMDGAESTKQAITDAAVAVERLSDRASPTPAVPASQDSQAQLKRALHTHLPNQQDSAALAPAARIRLTVSSGFYVRSFAHDLGRACGTLSTMADLLRSYAGGYTTIDPPFDGAKLAITYEDLEAGEDVWGPKVTSMLEQWLDEHPAAAGQERGDDRDSSSRKPGKGSWQRHQRGNRTGGGGSGSKRSWSDRRENHQFDSGQRRNSSSPE